MVPAGGGITQAHTSAAARKRHSSDSAAAETRLLRQARCQGVWGPDVPLPSPAPPAYLPQLLGGHRAERGVHAARLLLDARCLLWLQEHFVLPTAVLESKSMCSKVTSWKSKAAKAKPTQSPTPLMFSAL